MRSAAGYILPWEELRRGADRIEAAAAAAAAAAETRSYRRGNGPGGNSAETWWHGTKPTEQKQKSSRKKGRLARRDQLRIATYNMSSISKLQIQMLDVLGHDAVFLPEVWDSAEPLGDYGGHKRLLMTRPSGRGDRAGAVAWRLSQYAADRLDNWGVVPDAESRSLWIRFTVAGGMALTIIGVYVPPDYRTKPSQRDVLEAVEVYRNTIGKRSAVMVIGDYNAQLIRPASRSTNAVRPRGIV
jgi:hypothetical protein